ncbi:Hypothetical predicted protein [Pelobates cultripes]|uniref:Uncharacterized protein n=1 Tax=Pelobates cultripes TaxID=61616 RepID=A0AAD1SEI9_PELCU|nr:Hypothetical predicted protein [Pelobates cultripes]
MHAYAPGIPSDMLLVDRILPPLHDAHYFHIKDLVHRSFRSQTDPHPEYPGVRIMADLSAATLRRRRTFNTVMAELRNLGIKYRWGYPTKLSITKGRENVMVHTPEEGKKLLQEWGLHTGQTSRAAMSPCHTAPPSTAQVPGLGHAADIN